MENDKMPNRPMQQIAIPSGLLSCFLLIPLGRFGKAERVICRSRQASARGQEARQKQVAIPDRGRSQEKMPHALTEQVS
jgi:hypothetical protein